MITDVHAVVVDGRVVNTVVIDAATVAAWQSDGIADQVWPPGATLVNITTTDPQPGIDWSYDGQHWTAPPEPPPTPVSSGEGPAPAGAPAADSTATTAPAPQESS